MAKLSDLKQLLGRARSKRAAAVSATADSKASVTRPSTTTTMKRGQPVTPREQQAKGVPVETKQDLLLRDIFADVAPLGRRNRAEVHRSPPPPLPKMRMSDEADALVASKFGVEPAPGHWEVGQELEEGQTFVRNGVGTDVLAKLRRGHWVVQAELDLHGCTTDEAREALGDFLYAARNAGQRCVRVIHGKGLSSFNKEPVLKGKVRKWLAQWDDVLAYCEAPRHAGGGGAVMILLRGRM